MENWQERTELLLGTNALEKIYESHVLIVGLGGVGSYAAEQLVRAGVKKLSLVDGDVIQASNINRQLPADTQTIGQKKTLVLKKRFLKINPNLLLNIYDTYLEADDMASFISKLLPDFVIDAIDTISPKVHLIKACVENNIKLVSSMGAGARIDPTKVHITDIKKSYNDRLAFRIRKRLRKHQIYKGFPVVFSSELPNKDAIILIDGEKNKKSTTGTISYMPAIFGLMCASVVIRYFASES